jgi:hypothetical protein
VLTEVGVMVKEAVEAALAYEEPGPVREQLLKSLTCEPLTEQAELEATVGDGGGVGGGDSN